MNKTTKSIIRIILAAVLLLVGLLLQTSNPWVGVGVFLAAYLTAGGDVVIKAVKNIFRGQWLDENFLMSIATIGAIIIGEYPEGIGVMLFYQLGELFQDHAVNKSRKSIAGLMDIRPDYAHVKRGEEWVTVSPEEVNIGDTILIKAGEKTPLDGIVREGASMLDTSALTGESVPREVVPGSTVLSGCINLNGLLTVEVTHAFEESTVNKILDLVENAAVKKAKAEHFITKFARYYTPVVVILAAIIAVLPPLILSGESFADWVYRGLTFLVISCPCALVVSIPLSFFGGIGGASRNGILVKGGNYLEILAKLETVVFDKTGTLTQGVFKVQEIQSVGMDKNKLLELAAYAENYSNHPISISLREAYQKEIDSTRITASEEIPGYGVRAVIDGNTVYAGNVKLMKAKNVSYQISEDIPGTMVLLAVNQVFAGYIVIADALKADAIAAIHALRAAKIKKVAMLTGDAKLAGEKAAKELGVDSVFTELLPGDKVEKLETLLRQTTPKRTLAFVGDGINDAPVLARADVGIAMGGLGSDAAIEAADVVIMTDEPSKIASAIKIARKTLRIVKQNIIFTLTVKGLVLILAAAGAASMWAGVLADVGVALLAVLNAARALNVSKL